MLHSRSSRGGVCNSRWHFPPLPSIKPIHGSLRSRRPPAISHPLSLRVHLQRILLFLLLFGCPAHGCTLSRVDQSFCPSLQGTQRRKIRHLWRLLASHRHLSLFLPGHPTVHWPPPHPFRR